MKKKCVICRTYFKITGKERTADTRTLCKKCRKVVKKLDDNTDFINSIIRTETRQEQEELYNE